MKAVPFEETLFRELREPEFASAYLQDALDDSPEEFFVALRKYVQANDGMGHMAKSADIARESLYRMLSENGNPAFKSVESILRASGLRIRFDVQDREEALEQAERALVTA